MRNRLSILIASALIALSATSGAAEGLNANRSAIPTQVPGVIIDHSPASQGIYFGSPSIVILPDRSYVASHDLFGPNGSATTLVFRSEDFGKSWQETTQIAGAYWATLFVHRDSLYLFGTTKEHGHVAIRRSDDGGRSWTDPVNAESGLLTDAGAYHTAPVPVLIHNGRIWRGVEDANNGWQWGARYQAMVISAAVDANLLNRDSWTFSNFITRDTSWLDNRFEAFLEGNAVASPDGQVYDILRMHYGGAGGKAAMIRISDDGRTATFDPVADIIDFPGGAKKFTIRFDPKSKTYYSLTNPVVPIATKQERNAGSTRNTLALMRSTDLRNWEMQCILLYHPDVIQHAFQYPDWQFDGDDIIAAIRTAYDDGVGGAHRGHDANYMTFHRFENFRDLTLTDSVVDPESLELPKPIPFEIGAVSITADAVSLKTLADGEQAFANRNYVWQDIPKQLAGWQFTQTTGGVGSAVTLSVKTDTTIYVAGMDAATELESDRWTATPELNFHYSDRGKTKMSVLKRDVKAGETIEIPQTTWSGTVVLIPAPTP